METRNLLQEGQTKKYFTVEQITPLLSLQTRALKATTAFLRYLDSCQGEAPTGWDFDTPPKPAPPPDNAEPD